MPVRKITNKGCKKNTGFFPSEKNDRSIAYESLLERDYMYLLEFDPAVLSYIEQPVKIFFKLNGKLNSYTPDLQVIRVNKSQIIEIKPLNRLQQLSTDEKFNRKITAAVSFCQSHNFEFKVVTDQSIHEGNLLKNIKLLFKFSRIRVPSSEYLRIRNVLIASHTLSIDELLSSLADTHLERKQLKTYVFSFMLFKKISV